MEHIDKSCADVIAKGTQAVSQQGAVQKDQQPVIESIKMTD